MLRAFGRSLRRSLLSRYPDDTEMIARRIADYLEPGETVLAAVFVQSPGTNSAGLEAGLGNYGAHFYDEDERNVLWMKQTETLGIDPKLAKRASKLVVAVTTSRLLLVRRGSVTGRMRELLAAWPAGELDRVAVPRRGNSLRIFGEGAELKFELPNEHRFIAQVYRDLPDIFSEVQAGQRPKPDA